MSKFKIGDRVRKVGRGFLYRFEMGEELIVVGVSPSTGNAMVARETETGVWDTAYDFDLKLIQSTGPETITLTRYIKPATIEINGVEYILPEKKDAA